MLFLFSDQIIARVGDWQITSKNPVVHLFQYHLLVEDYVKLKNQFSKLLLDHVNSFNDTSTKLRDEVNSKIEILGTKKK